ncbi:MAG: GH25 family lysozyme [Polyangiaceae bacterium]
MGDGSFGLPMRFTAVSVAPFALALTCLGLSCTATNETGESERTGSSRSAATVCADGETVEGIDVSKWQASVDWTAVAGDGMKFAFTRISYSTSKDSTFDTNWAGMKSAGLVRGAYQYFLAGDDPIAQADLVINTIGTLEPMDLPPVIDIEGSGNEGVTSDVWKASVKAWVQRIEQHFGRKPILYVGKYFWQDNFGADTDYVDYPLWIPNYSASCPNLPDNTWTTWKFFQNSSTESIGGESPVDHDLFNGNYAALLAFAGPATPPYAAQFVSQSFPAANVGKVTLQPGETVDAYVELKNIGTATWDANTRLATTAPRDRVSVFAGAEWPANNRYAAVTGSVAPGETYKFNFTMHAPDQPGTYAEHFGVVQESTAWFSDPGQGGPTDDLIEGIFEVVGTAGTGGTAGSSGAAGSSGNAGSSGVSGSSGSSAGGSSSAGSGGTDGGDFVTITFTTDASSSGSCAVGARRSERTSNAGLSLLTLALIALRRRRSR